MGRLLCLRHHLQVRCRPHHLQHHCGQVRGRRGWLAHRLTGALSRTKRNAEAGLREAFWATIASFLQAVFYVNLTSMVLTVKLIRRTHWGSGGSVVQYSKPTVSSLCACSVLPKAPRAFPPRGCGVLAM